MKKKNMFFKIFYRGLITLVSLFTLAVGACFVYAAINSTLTDKIIIGAIFIAEIFVGTFLIHFYGSAVTSCELSGNDIIMKNMSGGTFTKERGRCTQITDKPNRVIVEFDDGTKYYICKNYFFGKKFFDFSVLNNENFKNADIVK